ncbi:nucleoside triphosphate pyrophosphohydrolase [Parvularcula sp. ZS-1/3]|uniref:Nucleoside triphosphate pyrophosphohydrolase n=1 Tax=Parvularcula mediterranea TaxID=2732508 RepID=A0A7Y3W4A8_9PROT|nr:nucleoside triphosphate pyrophosphohydrolase [Parvularcula mediterranea]NNU15067.1 nucleoside triphosphate pyrophosphohydrolase [Parvularcula mediterranea]
MAKTPPTDVRSIEGLKELMAKLRDPDGGCPWDVEQDHKSIARYCIEEAYEVVDAIEHGSDADLVNELGDLLLQVVFHAQMAKERGAFTFEDVVEGIVTKMVRRHPHVFEAADGRDADGQTVQWEEMKARERAEKGDDSLLADVPVGLPALSRAEKLTKRAARVGFEWEKPEHILDKLEEEIGELREAMASGDERHTEEELGDVAFCVANIGRRLKIDTETALRFTNEKFEKRFRHIEARVEGSGRNFEDHSLEELEAYWQEAKSL